MASLVRQPIAPCALFVAIGALAPSACAREEPAVDAVASDAARGAISQASADLGGGVVVPDASEPPPPSGSKRGLAALTRDLVDGVKATENDDPLALIPARATMLLQARPVEFFKIPGFMKAIDFVVEKGDGEATHALAGLSTCGLDLAQLDSVTFAVDEKSDGVLVLRGKGFGEPDKWRCLKRELMGEGVSADFEIREVGGKLIVQATDDDDTGRFVDDDTFVFLDGAWASDVDALIEGKEGKAVVAGALQPVIDRVDTKAPLWFGAVVMGEAKSGLDSSPFKGIDEVWGALSIAEDHELSLTVATRAPSADAAETMRGAVQEQWDSAKSMASTFGLPSSLLSKIEFKATADIASFHMRATPGEIEAVGIATKGFF